MKRLLFLVFLFSSFASAECECEGAWEEYHSTSNIFSGYLETTEIGETIYCTSSGRTVVSVSDNGINPAFNDPRQHLFGIVEKMQKCNPDAEPEPEDPDSDDDNGTEPTDPDTDPDDNGTEPTDPEPDPDDGDDDDGGGGCPDPASTKNGFPYVGTSSSLSACNTSIADFGGGNGAVDVISTDGKECVYCYYTEQEQDCKEGFHYRNPPDDLTCVKDDCGANQINTSDGCMCAEGYDPLIFSDPLECVEEETEDPEEDGCEKAKDSLHGYPFQNSYKTAVLCRDAIDTLGGGLGAESTDKTVENCPTHCYYEKEEDEEDEDPEEDGEDDNETDTPGEEGEDGEDDNETDTPGEEGEDDNETDTPGEEGEEVNFEFEFDEESADAYKQEAGSIIEGILSDSFSELTTLYSINIPAPAGCGCEDIQETILGFPLKIEYCSPLKELFEIARPILWLVFLVSLLFNFLRSNP